MRRVIFTAAKGFAGSFGGKLPFAARRELSIPEEFLAYHAATQHSAFSTATPYVSKVASYSDGIGADFGGVVIDKDYCSIKYKTIDRELAESIVEGLSDRLTLSELRIQGCTINEEAAEILAPALRMVKKSVYLSDCELDENFGVLLQDVQGFSKGGAVLKVNNCSAASKDKADAFFDEIANCGFTSFVMTGSLLDDEVLEDEVIGKYLANNRRIKEFYLTPSADLPFSSVAKALEDHPSLKFFSVGGVISGEGTLRIARSLENNSVISRLQIASDLDLEQMDELCSSIEKNVALREVRVFSSTRGAEYEKMNKTLKGITDRNYSYIRDTVNDYARSILGARFVVASRCREGGEMPLSVSRLYLHKATRDILFDGMSSSEIADFCKFWHDPLTQSKTLELKDYGGKTWDSLVGEKEIEVPEDVAGKSGVRMVELLSAAELVEQGRAQQHCVGGYAVECLTKGSHIFAIIDDEGKPLSTIEYCVDESGNVMELQHYGLKNSDPASYLSDISEWFLEQIECGEFEVVCASEDDCKSIEIDSKEEALYLFGYDPFDKKKCQQVRKAFKKDMIPKDRPYSEKIARNLERLMVAEVVLGGDGNEGEFFKHEPFTIPSEHREVKFFVQSEAQRQENIARKAAKAAEVFPKIQENLDRLFGEGLVTAELVLIDGQRRVAFKSELAAEVLCDKLSRVPSLAKDGSLEVVDDAGKTSVLAKNIGPAHLAESLAATPLSKVADSKYSKLEELDRSCATL